MGKGATRTEPAVVAAAEVMAPWPLWLGVGYALALLFAGAPSGGDAGMARWLHVAVAATASASALAWARIQRGRRLDAAPRGRDELAWAQFVLGASGALLIGCLVLGVHVPLLGTGSRLVVGASAVGSALAGAVLSRRAARFRRLPWGVIDERGPDGLALRLERAGSGQARHLRLSELPEGCTVGTRLTLAELRTEGTPGAPYRGGVPLQHAGCVWIGSADELARGLVVRAAGWLAWAAFSAAVWAALGSPL